MVLYSDGGCYEEVPGAGGKKRKRSSDDDEDDVYCSEDVYYSYPVNSSWQQQPYQVKQKSKNLIN